MSVPTASRERSARLRESACQTSSTTPAWKHLAVSPNSKGILLQVGISWKSWVNLLRMHCRTFKHIYPFKISPPWGLVACRRSSPTVRKRPGRAPAKPTSAMEPPLTQAGWPQASWLPSLQSSLINVYYSDRWPHGFVLRCLPRAKRFPF